MLAKLGAILSAVWPFFEDNISNFLSALGGYIIRIIQKTFFYKVKCYPLENNRTRNNFYKFLCREVRKGGSFYILNFSTNPIGGIGECYNEKYNDPSQILYRGIYFEMEELFLTGETDRLDTFFNSLPSLSYIKRWKLNRFQKKILYKYKKKIHDIYNLMRTFSIVSDESYKLLTEKAAKGDNECKDALHRIRLRHVSICEHLERTQCSKNYGVTAVNVTAYVPNPTVILVKRKQKFRKVIWGFLRPIQQVTEDDMSLEFHHKEVIDCFSKLRDNYQSSGYSLDIKLLKKLDSQRVSWDTLVKMNPSLMRDTERELESRLEKSTLKEIKSEL